MQIAAWHAEKPNDNFAAFVPAGFVVIDTDAADVLQQLEADERNLPLTLTDTTRRRKPFLLQASSRHFTKGKASA